MRISDWSSDVCSSDLAELKYLRRWMRDAGLQLHSDLRISPEVNLRNQTAELSAEALAKIDVLILDDRAWYDLAGSERQAVLSAARAGLGVLVLLGSEPDRSQRSEEHTSELQSLMRNTYAVFCL